MNHLGTGDDTTALKRGGIYPRIHPALTGLDSIAIQTDVLAAAFQRSTFCRIACVNQRRGHSIVCHIPQSRDITPQRRFGFEMEISALRIGKKRIRRQAVLLLSGAADPFGKIVNVLFNARQIPEHSIAFRIKVVVIPQNLVRKSCMICIGQRARCCHNAVANGRGRTDPNLQPDQAVSPQNAIFSLKR